MSTLPEWSDWIPEWINKIEGTKQSPDTQALLLKYGISITQIMWNNWEKQIQIQSNLPMKDFSLESDPIEESPLPYMQREEKLSHNEIFSWTLTKLDAWIQETTVYVDWLFINEKWEEDLFSIYIDPTAWDSLDIVELSIPAPEGYFHLWEIFTSFGGAHENEFPYFPIEMREVFNKWKKAGIEIRHPQYIVRSSPKLYIYFQNKDRAAYIIDAWMDVAWQPQLVHYMQQLVPQKSISDLDTNIQNDEVSLEEIINNPIIQTELSRTLPYLSDTGISKLKQLVIKWKDLSFTKEKDIGILPYVPNWETTWRTSANWYWETRIIYRKKSDWISFVHIDRMNASILDIPIQSETEK